MCKQSVISAKEPGCEMWFLRSSFIFTKHFKD